MMVFWMRVDDKNGRFVIASREVMGCDVVRLGGFGLFLDFALLFFLSVLMVHIFSYVIGDGRTSLVFHSVMSRCGLEMKIYLG